MSLSNTKRESKKEESSTGVDNLPKLPKNKKRSKKDKYELRLLIPSKAVGSIIGKGGANGANIQKLRDDNNAVVQIPDFVGSGPESVLVVRAEHEDTILAVIVQILPLLTEEAVNSGQQKNLASGSRNKSQEVRILVHQSFVGGIIGKGGSKIKEIRVTSKARIRVFEIAAPGSTEQCVSVRGSAQEIVLAIKEIFSVIFNAETRRNIQLYNSKNFDGFYADQYGGYGSESDNVGRPYRGGSASQARAIATGLSAMRVGDLKGSLAGDRPGSPEFMNRHGLQQADPVFDSDYLAAYKGNLADIDEDGVQETCEVTVPSKSVGAIFGHGGNNIRRMKTESHCTITVGKHKAGSKKQIITIVGTQTQIQLARYLLHLLLQEHGGPPPSGPSKEDSEDGLVHVRIQQKNKGKTLTTVQGLSNEYDLKKIVRSCKKEFACNGIVVEHPEYGEFFQLQGDQRHNVGTWMIKVGLLKADQLKIHDF